MRELLTHHSYFELDNCPRDADGSSDCSEVLLAGRQRWRCNDEGGHICCPRRYQNANYQLLRQLLQEQWGVASTQAFAQASRAHWLDEIGLEGASCNPSDAMHYYGRTDAGEWRGGAAERSGGCDASGWHLSALELGRLLRALRYRWLLDASASEAIDGCGETGWVAWDLPWPGRDVKVKNGKLRNAEYQVDTVVARLPNHIDVVLLLNTRTALGADNALRHAWFGD